jgi:hypothetical protein
MTDREPPTDLPTVLSVIKFLRDGWISDVVDAGNVDYLADIAAHIENGWLDSACCPMCQEVECDEGCPLEHHRPMPNNPLEPK